MISTTRAGLATGLVVLTVLSGVSDAKPKTQQATFGAPVRLTPTTGFGGFEPSLVVDRSNTVWVTAHKAYHGQVSPDDDSALGARSSSWLWTSKDGKTFVSPPGSTAQRQHEQFLGDEGDLAVSPDNDVYFVDLGFASSAFTAWKVDPRSGAIAVAHEDPRMKHVVPGSDRPFIAAGKGGVVLVVQNQLGSVAVGTNGYAAGYDVRNPTSEIDDDPTYGNRTGQSGLFLSRDGGRTFTSPLPFVVDRSKFCRPLVDRKDAAKMMVVCNQLANDAVVVTRSTDGGRTWTRHDVRPATKGRADERRCVNFPSVAQGARGVVYVLCNDYRFAGDPNTGAAADRTQLVLSTSRDFGRTWSSRDVTPEAGLWDQASIAASDDGKLGIGSYFRPDRGSTWQFRAAVFRPGADAVSTEVSAGQSIARADSGTAPGDFTQVGFGPDNKLHVAYNISDFQDVATQPTKFTALHQVWYAKQS